MKRILTGDRPTGKLHLGHYVGTLANRVKLQNEYDTYIMIANIQGLTDNFNNPSKVRDNIIEVIKDYYAVGLDFNKCKIFIQSQVSAINEIFVYLSNFVSVQKIMHNPTIKTEIAEKGMSESTPLGFFYYPIHQVADILCVKADLVPVGKDQAPMIEDAREIARKFNQTYSVNILPEPEALFGITENLPGTDGNSKMSKSLNNCIYLSDDDETLKKKVNSIYTDPTRLKVTDKGHLEGNVAFIYHDIFNPNKEEVKDLKDRYVNGEVSDKEVKEKLFIALKTFLDPIRERRKEAEQKQDELFKIVLASSKAVSDIANQTLSEMKEVMKIKF